jgi:hypothetical protein
MTLSEIPDSEPGAASRTVACADDARNLGFTNVETGYQPQTGMHTVTGEYPDTAARRLVDGLLGR